MRSPRYTCLAGCLLASLTMTWAPLASKQVSGGASRQPEIDSRLVPIIATGKLRFRDLDRDGRLTPYEDWRLPAERRAIDLVSRMTLEEKAGAMLHPVMGSAAQVTTSLVNSVLSRSSAPPQKLAQENNALQEAAETTRLAIPVTISTDPRNGFTETFGVSSAANGFSQWPDYPGLGASRDPSLLRRFGDIARQEHRAVGFAMALAPQADIATDPRWARTSGTFGDDAELVGRLAAAYVDGIQGGAHGITRNGVAAVVKHYAGYGAIKDGWDSHSRYGRFSTYPGDRFEEHVAAFRPSFRVRVAGVMPTYSILELAGHPQVGGGFNQVLLKDILRTREGFGGLVLSDWSITEDCRGPCLGEPLVGKDRRGLIGKPWGVENLSRAERVVLTIQVGVDQIGLDAGGDVVDSSPIVAAVRAGKLTQARVDEAVRKILTIKFQSGLFENPYVDPERAARIVGQPSFQQAALDAQHRSLVLLENKNRLLPLAPSGKRVFLKGIDPATAREAGFTVVDSLDQADLAILRVATPHQLIHPNYPFGRLQHEGDMDFKPDNKDLAAIQQAAAKVPTIVSVYLERPAILTNVSPLTSVLIGNFGASDRALLDLVAGKVRPTGKLPFELPSSMAAAHAQKPDVPQDSADPLYRSGFGLTF